MLKELVNEIIELLNEVEAKDNRISELQAQVQNLTDTINGKNEENKLLNDQIIALQLEKEKLQGDLEVANNSISQLRTDISNLQVQADLKLDEVKNIVEDLKGLIANA